MSILILRRIVQRYERERSYKNGGIVTGNGTPNHIPMWSEIKNREYTKPDY